jgi:hypothetical protein
VGDLADLSARSRLTAVLGNTSARRALGTALSFGILLTIPLNLRTSLDQSIPFFGGLRREVQTSRNLPAPSAQTPQLDKTVASGGRTDGVAPGLGWHELPDTELATRCPSVPEIQGNTGCSSVIIAWNGGVADLKRNRLIIWGGGHSDYFGNELYALDINRASLERITDPSPVSNVGSCPEAYIDGKPSSRHTYNGLVYVPELDAMFSFGGSLSNCGGMSEKIWKLELNGLVWTLMQPHRGDKILNAPGISADYDPNTHAVFFSDTASFFRYDSATNNVKKLADLHGVDDHLTGVIDPERKLFVMAGYPGQFWAIDIGPHSKYNPQDWSKKLRGCDPLLQAPDPGLAFDPVQHKIVGWAGGDPVYLLDLDQKTCTEQSFPGGPGKAQQKGSFGRFRYFPALGVFVIVNDWKRNAFALRLTEPRSAILGGNAIVSSDSR